MTYEMYYKKSSEWLKNTENNIAVIANEYGADKNGIEKCYYTMLPIICNNFTTYDIPTNFEEKSESEMLIEGLERYLATYKFSVKKYASLHTSGKNAILGLESLSTENTPSIFFRLTKLMMEDLNNQLSYYSMNFHKEVGKKLKAKDILSIEDAVRGVFEDRMNNAQPFINK